MKPEDKAAFEGAWKAHKEYVGSKILSNKAQGFDMWGRALAHRDAQPAGAQAPVAQYRGYALLGTGKYILNHSDDFHPKLGVELIITLATEKDKEGDRQIGETRDNPNHREEIQPEDMIIRIGFLNERGLFALENQLAEIRKQFFADRPAPAFAVNEALLIAAKAVAFDAQEVNEFDVCTGVFVPLDTFQKSIEAIAVVEDAKGGLL